MTGDSVGDSEYLGFGLGLGVQIDAHGRLLALVRHGLPYALKELGGDLLRLTSRPAYAHRLASAGVGQVSFPEEIRYAFSGETGDRIVRIRPAEEELALEFAPRQGAGARLELHASHGWRSKPDEPSRATTILRGHYGEKLEVTVVADSGVTVLVDGDVASWAFPREGTVKFSAKPVSVFAPVIIIAGTLEMAAVLSSCFMIRTPTCPSSCSPSLDHPRELSVILRGPVSRQALTA
jgi:hypothetical protein